ncbi:MAG TPA: low affinity iron permease family protein [Chthoniobacterales bacterium]
MKEAPGGSLKDYFTHFARQSAEALGSVWAFTLALLVVATWILTGPLFGFSDTWQLVINTGTTIITFIMVFLIQSTQNRDAKAVHLKLDELLRAIRGARTNMVDLEDLPDEELEAVAREFRMLHERASHEVHSRGKASPRAEPKKRR